MSVITKFSGVRVLCLGDVMLDRFVNGDVHRISPESPVPILFVSGSSDFAGGAANVARNISALGSTCTLIGVIGQDSAGRELQRLIGLNPGIYSALVEVEGRPTTEKVRFVARGQHMLRADSENSSAMSPEVERKLLTEIERHINHHQVLVLSDYAKGVLSPTVVAGAIRIARSCGVPVIVDPKAEDFRRYDGATVVTPNTREVQRATGIDVHDDSTAVAAGQQLLAKTEIESILITRSAEGMTLVTRQQPALHVPASAREVADVVGAGDTVVATLALAIGCKLDLSLAVRIANAAAAIVVGKHGTATTTQSELIDEFEFKGKYGPSVPRAKIFTREAMRDQVQSWRRDGLKVGFTNGCFDILHVGHISILGFARAHCDRLVVAANTDTSVRRLKGPERPINNEEDRSMVLAALASVDGVVLFDEATPQQLIEFLEPDVLVKGSDYEIDQIVGADFVLARGGEVFRFELVPGRSTTKTIARASGIATASE